MVALDSEVQVHRRRGVEVAIAVAVSVALVLGVYAVGRAIDDSDDGAADSGAAASDASGAAANVAAEPAGSTPDSAAHAHDDAAAAEVDDRGFAALSNGEQHGHEFTQAVSDEDRVELGRQLALAREVALRYPTVKDAEAAGLRRAGPFYPGLGAHYIAFANGLANADGVMSDDDIAKPLAWMYDGTQPDSRVVGLFYGTAKENAEGFAGPNDIWHQHSTVCIKTGPNGIDAPLGADRDSTKEQCEAIGGRHIERTQYLLHTWVVPGFESPEGVYADLSSAITCDDGTYNIIPDVTKTGTARTVCVDGSE